MVTPLILVHILKAFVLEPAILIIGGHIPSRALVHKECWKFLDWQSLSENFAGAEL